MPILSFKGVNRHHPHRVNGRVIKARRPAVAGRLSTRQPAEWLSCNWLLNISQNEIRRQRLDLL